MECTKLVDKLPLGSDGLHKMIQAKICLNAFADISGSHTYRKDAAVLILVDYNGTN